MDLAIVDISYKWNYTVCGFILFFTQHNVYKVHLCCACISISLPLWLNNIALYGYNTFCLLIHQLVDICVISTCAENFISQLEWVLTFRFGNPNCFILTYNSNNSLFTHHSTQHIQSFIEVLCNYFSVYVVNVYMSFGSFW